MTKWEDCKRDTRRLNIMFLFTLNLTENDNCKRYGEYEYDRKRLQTFRLTGNITDYYLYLQIDWNNVYSGLFRSYSMLKKETFTVF